MIYLSTPDWTELCCTRGWHYDLGHRICITGLGAKATKTRLQVPPQTLQLECR